MDKSENQEILTITTSAHKYNSLLNLVVLCDIIVL
jgi:hypothetical protein